MSCSTDELVYAGAGVVVPFLGTVAIVKLWRGEPLPCPLLGLVVLFLVSGGRRR